VSNGIPPPISIEYAFENYESTGTYNSLYRLMLEMVEKALHQREEVARLQASCRHLSGLVEPGSTARIVSRSVS
jgi:hypothetical protein